MKTIIFVLNNKTMSYIISIYFEKRRAKENGKFNIKLRVYNKLNNIKKVRYFTTGIDLTQEEFDTIWINAENKKLRGKNKEILFKLQDIEKRANVVAEQMTVFDFKKFEMKLFRKSSDKNNVQYHFEEVIKENIKRGKIGTAESYKYTLNSFKEFSENEKKCAIDKLTFETITADWLNDYESFMVSKGKSYTTISIYTRTLRVVFNNAIASNDINKEVYPFGLKKAGKYKIPKTKKVKKALTSTQLKVLFNAEVKNENEAKAKAFWFFSYVCNGMNLKDVALLKYSDIKDDKFSYYRAKTFDKTAEKTTITIFLTDFTKQVIADYGNEVKSGFVFSIIDIKDDSLAQYKKIKNFTRYINDHIKRVAKANDLPNDLSTYWARHSFATNSLRKGASMEFISEALNHSDLSVTKNYFAGFEDDAKKEFANSLLDF
ncbi:site-specific integrase [Bizionia saleffrena]|uniref:Site-specific integrase n=1 Tax=Bizionia saleffrena TaxID=291189 RepID=A0A8H2LHP7_9FLAO|nr:site-specific integrase [Bizionia saleffrena]TYB80338.1 site-specific integrase [Bizionia saleffrena]